MAILKPLYKPIRKLRVKKSKLHITDERMLQLPGILLSLGLINYKNDFLVAIDMPRQNLTNIKAGTQHFTVGQIAKVCKEYNINAGWIFGQTDKLFMSMR